MPVRALIVTDTYVELDLGGNILHFDFADFPPSASTNEVRQQHIIDQAQLWFDTRIKLKDLPADDPNKTTDPAMPHLFWEGTGGNAELVSRNLVIENVVYDDTATPPLTFRVKQIWPLP